MTLTPGEFNAYQARAERHRTNAAGDTSHALLWLEGATEKSTGTVPWRYDLHEAEALLESALKWTRNALEMARDPDTERVVA